MNEAEIKQLQTAVEQLLQERDRALESANRWRRCYEVEAQQRRRSAETAEQQIKQLRAEVQQMIQLKTNVEVAKSSPALLLPSSEDEHGQVLRLLTGEITKLRQECDRLSAALAEEQAQHAQTRSNFITALSDVMQHNKLQGSSSGSKQTAIR
jgi:uncharacterized coiled-coil DUF342 family protein